MSLLRLAAVLALTGAPALAAAQDAMPSPQQAAAQHSQEASATQPSGQASEDAFPTHAWELPPIRVRGEQTSPLREEDHVGSYRQPRWTATRRFPTTRVYVVPAGKFEFEWWNRWQAPLEHLGHRKLKSQYEFEFGLGYHLQVDLYLQTVQDGRGAPITLDEEKFEVRWALADWGVIPGNPTLYLEWARHNDDVDFLEGKILLGGEMAVGWHWGVNLIMEAGLGGENEKAYQIAGGIGRTLCDEVLSLGLEAKAEFVNNDETDFGNEKEILGGPSISWSPVPPLHILFTPLFGVAIEDGESTGAFEGWAIMGWTL